MEVYLKFPIRDVAGTSADAIEFKYKVIDAIENTGIGQVTGSGMGFGEIDIDVEMADSTDGISRLRALMKALQIESVEIRDS